MTRGKRGTPTFRQWSILQRLLQGPISRHDLAKELDCSTDTIRRDVEEVLEPLFPIRVEKDSNIVFYSYVRHPNLPIPSFTEEERSALLLGRDMIEETLQELPFAERLMSALDRIVHTQADVMRRQQEKLPQVYLSDFAIPSEQTHNQIILQQAALERRRVRMTYETRSRSVVEERIVEPLVLHLSSRGLQLIAFCHKADAVRVFSVRWIHQLTILDESFEPTDHRLDLEHYVDHSFDGYREGSVEDVHIIVRGDCARWAGHRFYHPSQHIEEKADGSVVIRFRCCGMLSLVRRLLMFGADVEIVEPETLNNLYHQAVEKLANKHGFVKEQKS